MSSPSTDSDGGGYDRVSPVRGWEARRVQTRVLPCSRCRKPLDLRFEFGPPVLLDLGRRDTVKLGFKCPDCGWVNERWSSDLVRFARVLGAAAAPDIVAGMAAVMHDQAERSRVEPDTKDAAVAAQAAARIGKLVLELSGALTKKVEVEVREAPSEASRLEKVVDELVEEIRKRDRAAAAAEGVAAAHGVDLSKAAEEPPAKGDGAKAAGEDGAAGADGASPPEAAS